jgi:hypothetical protein
LPQSVATTGRSVGDGDNESAAGDDAGWHDPIVAEFIILRVVFDSFVAAVDVVVRTVGVGDNHGDSTGVVDPPFIAFVETQVVSDVAIGDGGAGIASFPSFSTGHTTVPRSSSTSGKSNGNGNNKGDAGDVAGADDTVLVETVIIRVVFLSVVSALPVQDGASNIGLGWFSVLPTRPCTLPRFAFPMTRGKGAVDADDSLSVTFAVTQVVFVSLIAVVAVGTAAGSFFSFSLGPSAVPRLACASPGIRSDSRTVGATDGADGLRLVAWRATRVVLVSLAVVVLVVGALPSLSSWLTTLPRSVSTRATTGGGGNDNNMDSDHLLVFAITGVVSELVGELQS